MKTMITEDYCSPGLAQALQVKAKELFDYYHLADDEEVGLYKTVTHQRAMKWLREVYKVNIEIHYNRYGENYKYLIIYKPVVLDDIHSLGVYFHYEEAVEAALKYVLENLI